MSFSKRTIVKFVYTLLGSLLIGTVYWRWNASMVEFSALEMPWEATFQHTPLYLWLALIILGILNIFIEATKWQWLLNNITAISWVYALRMTLGGVATSLLTPNKSGEFVGKIWYLSNALKLRGSVLSFLGSITQVFATISFGLVGLWWWRDTIQMNTSRPIFLGIGMFLLILIAFGFWKPLRKKIATFSIIRKLKLGKFFLRNVPQALIVKVLALSLIKYLVFSTQFVLMLYICGEYKSLCDLYSIVFCLYLFLMITPTNIVLEISVRGGLAVVLFGYLGINKYPALFASIGLYIMNILVPALIGGIGIVVNLVANKIKT